MQREIGQIKNSNFLIGQSNNKTKVIKQKLIIQIGLKYLDFYQVEVTHSAC